MLKNVQSSKGKIHIVKMEKMINIIGLQWDTS